MQLKKLTMNSTRNMLLLLTMVGLLATLISCQTIKLPGEPVPVKDQLWYADKGPLGALRVHTMNDLQLEVNKANWDNLRLGMMCTDPATFGEVQRVIQLLCSYYGQCEYPDIVTAMNNLERLKRTGQRARQQALEFQQMETK